jgi:hypothetical protein
VRHVALILAVAVALALTSAAVPATAPTGEAAMEQTVTWDKGKDKGEETSQSTLPSTGGFVPLDGVGGLLGVGGHRLREHLRKLQLCPLQRGDLRKGPRQEPPRQVFRRPQGRLRALRAHPGVLALGSTGGRLGPQTPILVRTTTSFVVENGRPGARRI